MNTAAETAKSIDPITFSVIKNGLDAIVDEVAYTVIRTARSLFPASEKVGDQSTMDLLTQRMQIHEKTAWMLRSLIA